MPKGGRVDRAIRDVLATGKSKGSAIAILKAQGTIKQTGAHLAPARRRSYKRRG